MTRPGCACPLFGACLEPLACPQQHRPCTEAERRLAAFRVDQQGSRRVVNRALFDATKAQVARERRP